MNFTDFLWGVSALAALMLPGWLVARATLTPQPMLAGFVGSAVGLVTLVIAFDALKIPLSLGPLAAGWTVVVAIAAIWLWRRKRAGPPPPPANRSDWNGDRILLLPAVPMLAVVAYRAAAQPLFGVDTAFRWNHLATQMIARHSIDFYPPVTAADYQIYAWPDGIAPLVSSLYFWIYSIAGANSPGLTAPLVVFQYVLVLIGVHLVAQKYFSPRAAVFSCALAACSPVLGWAAAMGQETGLTAMATLALLAYLPRDRNEETTATMFFAGAAAGLGALAREYGLVLIVLGLVWCAARRLSRRAVGIFLVASVVSVAPWYLRNWFRTGNPLFNLTLGGWFPTNAVFTWLNESYQVEFGWSHLPAEAARLFVVNCVVGIIGFVAGAMLGRRQGGAMIATVVVFTALWLVSLGYTAAGFVYSLRVLSPALAVAAVLGGAALARWIPGPQLRHAALIGLTLFAFDAALRTLTLPANVYRVAPADWPAVGRAVQDYHERPIYRELARVAGNERMLVLGPNALLTRHGARTVPLWSPEVRFLFDPSTSAPETARKLRDANIGFVLVNTGVVNERFLARSSYFRDPLGTLRPVWSDTDMVLSRIEPFAAQ